MCWKAISTRLVEGGNHTKELLHAQLVFVIYFVVLRLEVMVAGGRLLVTLTGLGMGAPSDSNLLAVTCNDVPAAVKMDVNY